MYKRPIDPSRVFESNDVGRLLCNVPKDVFCDSASCAELSEGWWSWVNFEWRMELFCFVFFFCVGDIGGKKWFFVDGFLKYFGMWYFWSICLNSSHHIQVTINTLAIQIISHQFFSYQPSFCDDRWLSALTWCCVPCTNIIMFQVSKFQPWNSRNSQNPGSFQKDSPLSNFRFVVKLRGWIIPFAKVSSLEILAAKTCENRFFAPKETSVFQASIFRCELLVSGRVYVCIRASLMFQEVRCGLTQVVMTHPHGTVNGRIYGHICRLPNTKREKVWLNPKNIPSKQHENLRRYDWKTRLFFRGML